MATYAEIIKLPNEVENVKTQIAENATKVLSSSMPINSLTDSTDGIIAIDSIKGRTRYKKSDGTYTDVWESGCTLASVGETEGNKIEVLTTGVNLCNVQLIHCSVDEKGVSIPVSSEFYLGTSKMIQVLPNNNITIELFDTTIQGLYIYFFGKNKEFLYRKNIYNVSRTTFLADSNSYYIMFYIFKSSGVFSLDTKCMITIGNEFKPYEPYKEDKISISLKEPLMGLQNAVDEVLVSQNKLIRRIGKAVLNGSESDWGYEAPLTNTINFYTGAYIGTKASIVVSDKFSFSNWTINSNDIENILCSGSGKINIRVLKSKLTQYGYIEGTTSTYITAFKAWLQANPTTIYYELATPVEEELQIPSLKCYKSGTLQLNNAITSTISIKYPSNLSGRMSNIEFELDRLGDSYFNTLKSLLIIADKEAKMKTINLLTTETTADLKNKINEILNIWR